MIQIFFNSPIFSTFVVHTFYVAKYRTIRIIVDPLFPSFLHHHRLQILCKLHEEKGRASTFAMICNLF